MISYELKSVDNLSESQYEQLSSMGRDYAEDIGGLDLGFESLLVVSNKVLLVEDENKLVGFLMGGQTHEPSTKDKKSFCPTAVYLHPEYRDKEGKHKDVLKNSLESLVDNLETQDFERLKVIHSAPGMVTDFGYNHVLKNLYKVLFGRTEKGVGKLINTDIENFDPIYIFKPKVSR